MQRSTTRSHLTSSNRTPFRIQSISIIPISMLPVDEILSEVQTMTPLVTETDMELMLPERLVHLMTGMELSASHQVSASGLQRFLATMGEGRLLTF